MLKKASHFFSKTEFSIESWVSYISLSLVCVLDNSFSILYRILGELPYQDLVEEIDEFVSAFSIESWVSY